MGTEIEVVERVARAIAAEDNEEGYDAWEANPSESGRRCWYDYARAALEASHHAELVELLTLARRFVDNGGWPLEPGTKLLQGQIDTLLANTGRV